MHIHACNSWYFGPVTRQHSEEIVEEFILSRYTTCGIAETEAAGSFLVRLSGMPGLYSVVVTVWTGDEVKHIKVKSKMSKSGRLQLYLAVNRTFHSIEELITFYHSRAEESQPAFLRFPIPNPGHYSNKLWYKGAIGRIAAEQLLLSPPIVVGKFLVRDRIVQELRVGFTISFISDILNKSCGYNIQHMIAKDIGPYLKISETLKFWSLNHLIDHFSQNSVTSEGCVKLSSICDDGPLASSDEDTLTIELNEAYPYQENNKKLLFLKGFRFHDAVKITVGSKEYFEGSLGLRQGSLFNYSTNTPN